MLKQLLKGSIGTAYRKKYPKPPVIMRMPEEYFRKPKQEFQDVIPNVVKEGDEALDIMIKNTNEVFKAKRLKPKEVDTKYDLFKDIDRRLEVDEDSGLFKNMGLENEIAAFKIRNDLSHNENSFLENFSKLVEYFNCLSIYEFLEFYKHSVALRIVGDRDGKVMGTLLKEVVNEVLKNMTEQEKQIDGLVDKLAMKILYSKIEAALESKKNESSKKYNKILSFLISDPQVRPNRVITQDLMDRIYNLSNITVKEKAEKNDEGDLYKSYFEKKIEIMSNFANLPMEKEVTLEIPKTDFKIRFLQGMIEKQAAVTEKDLERTKLTLKLKEILGHEEIIESLDSTIAKLEKRANVAKIDMEKLPIVKAQLELLLHELPEEIRNKFKEDNKGSFKPRYLNNRFKASKLQWQNIDLAVPADIMPVQEYKDKIEFKRNEAHLYRLHPEYQHYGDSNYQDFKKEKETAFYGAFPDHDPDQSDVSHNFIYKEDDGYKGEVIIDKDRSKVDGQIYNVFTTEKETDEYADVLGEASDNESDLDENDEEDAKKDEKREITQNEKNFSFKGDKEEVFDISQDELYLKQLAVGRSRKMTEEQRKILLKKLKNRKGVFSLFGSHPHTSIKNLKSYVYKANTRQYLKRIDNNDENTGKPLDLYDNFFPHFERAEFFDEIKNKYGMYELDQENEGKKKTDLYDHLFQTERLKNPEMIHFDETFTKALDIYKEVNSSMYHKHYIQKLFKIRQINDPLQKSEMLDPENDPNYGLLKDKSLNDFSREIDFEGLMAKDNEEEDPIPFMFSPDQRSEDTTPIPKYFGYGQRKRCKALAIIELNGIGKITINDRPIIDFFYEMKDRSHAIKSIVALNKGCEIDVQVYIRGGGPSGQAEACLVAISNALTKAFPESEQFLKERYFTVVDPRRKERKKIGKYKARKSYTYVRR